MSIKTIAVVAANGRSGRVFVEASLNAGFTVKAGIRGEANLQSHPNLKVVNCDAMKYEDVESLIAQTDAVVSLIGHGKNSPPLLQTTAIEHVLTAMNTQGVKRLISLTGTGVRFREDKPSIIDRLANQLITTIDPARINDGIKHADVLKDSQLDWTILRVLKLGNLPYHKKTVPMNLVGPAKLLTSRRQVAVAIIQLLRDNTYIRQSPIIIR